MASMKIYRVTTQLILLGTFLLLGSVDGSSANTSRVAGISSTESSHEIVSQSVMCSSIFSCHGRCSKDTEWDNANQTMFLSPHCHCDPDCSKYRDCCADYRQACGNQSSPSSSDSPVPVCRRVNSAEPSMWMVESCPSSYKNRDIQNKCLSNEKLSADRLTELIPAISLLHPGLLFKNKYCAICNGAFSDFGLFLSSIRVRCNISPPEGLNSTQIVDYMLKYCVEIDYEIDKLRDRRFCFPTVSTCPPGASKEDEQQCERGPAAVVFSSTEELNYRNVHCIVCHGVDPKDAVCGPRSIPKKFFNPKSFEVVMKFEGGQMTKVRMTEPKKYITCGKGYAYDPHLEICRRAIQWKPTKAINDKYRLVMWLSPLDGKKPQNFSDTEFVQVLTTQFVDLLPSQVEVQSIGVDDRATCAIFDLHARQTNKENSTLKGMPLDALIDFKNTFKMKVAQRPWLVFKVTSKALSCVDREVYPHGTFEIHNKRLFVNSTDGKNVSYPLKQYYVVYSGNLSFTAYVCRSFFGLQCSHVMLAVKEKEYVMFANKSLLFKPTGQLYAEGEYDMIKKTPWICTNYSVTFTESNNKTNETLVKSRLLPVSIHTDIRRYMTIVGFTISIVCLFLVLLAHGILRDLREPLPGKNLISLSVSLLLAHFWYLLGSGDTDKPLFCHVTACILHYLFLASFGCTFIVAYDTRRTFSAKTAKAHAVGASHQTKRLAVYLLISWGLPLVLVVTCALLDWLDVVDIGYRNEDACWIGNETALLVVFAAPIGSVLVYNVLAFSQTIYAINSARKQTQRVKSSHYARPATVKIYIRLISLMGFSWFFGISAPLIHHGLMYPFVFFTTLQGLYIFLAFICKARVLRMLKAKLPLSKRQHVRHPTKGVMTTTSSLTSTPYSKYPTPRDETEM